MNLTDLREVLRDRADLADSTHEARMAGVRARVSTTRRRRAVAGAAFAALALVGLVYAVLPRVGPPPEPAAPVRSLPEYHAGTRLLAQAWGDLPSTSATVRFVPKSAEFSVITRCDIGEDRNLLIDVTVNGRSATEDGTFCGNVIGQSWSRFGVVPGQPSVATLTVTGERGEGDSWPPPSLPVPASGSFAVGIGEPVPFSEYPLPPRPPTLQKLPETGPGLFAELHSDPADPTARKEITIEWPGIHLMQAQLNTPGRLRVLVDDVEVIDLTMYSYGPYQSRLGRSLWETGVNGVRPEKGQLVKITVIPEGITGDWNVTLAP